MHKEEKSWIARPYESWRKGSKSAKGRTEKEILFQSRQRKWLIVGSTIMAISMFSMVWTILSDVVLWDRESIGNVGIGMFVLFLVGFSLGFFILVKRPYGAFYKLLIFANIVGGVGAIGLILLPVFVYANYILDFSEPEVFPVTVSDIKVVGNVGKRSRRFTFVMSQAPFETRTLSDQNQPRYNHLMVGEAALLVSGRGFFGFRYVREVRSNKLVDRTGRDSAKYFLHPWAAIRSPLRYVSGEYRA
jgi:hypothetical protein